MASDDVLLSLVNDVYEAALDPSKWPDFLRKMSRATGSLSGAVWMHDFSDRSADIEAGGGNLAAYVGFDDAALSEFASYYSSVNVWTENEGHYPSGSAVTSSMLYPDRFLKRTEFYGDWLRPHDMFYSLGSIVVKEDTRAVKLTFMRPEDAGAYGDDELLLMKRLMPHLQTAVALHRKFGRISRNAGLALDSLEVLPFGVVLLDAKGTIIHANQLAHAIVRKTSVLTFGPGGRLEAGSTAATGSLRRLVDSALALSRGINQGITGSAGGALQLPMKSGGALPVFVSPLSPQMLAFGHAAGACVFFSDPETVLVGLGDALQDIYSLSLSEASLAEALVNGTSLADFAEQRCTTLHTVRTQMKNLAMKVGAKRQVDVVRVILTGPAMLRVSRRAQRQ